MAFEFERVEIAPGARLHVSQERKWKTTLIVARLSCSLAEDPTRTALVPLVLARGTVRLRTPREVARHLEELCDADFDVDTLRLGDAQVVELRLEVAGSTYVGGRDTLGEGLDFLADVIFRPALDSSGCFAESGLAIEKENLRRAIEGLRDERAEYAVERTARLLGRGEPSERYQLGDVADLPSIGGADLAARWRALIARAHIDLFVCGECDAREVERAVRTRFPLASAADRIPAPLPLTAPRPGPEVREMECAALSQAHLCLGYRTGIGYLEKDYAPLAVLHALFGADAQSRLFKRVREKEGLAYEAGASFDQLKGTLTAHVGVDPRDVDRAEAIVGEELARLCEEAVPEPELEEARRYAFERLREADDDPLARAALEHAGALVGGEPVSHATLLDRLRAVTADEVREVARRLRLDAVFLFAPR